MILFLLIYFLIYGGVNYYIFWRVRAAFPGMGWWALLPAGFLLVMIIAPILVLNLQRLGAFRSARVLAWAGYPWMALAMWLFFLLLAAGAWNLAIKGAGLMTPRAALLRLGPMPALLSAGAVTVLLGLGSLREAGNVRLKAVRVRSRHLAAGAAPLRIVQLTDLHLGLLLGPEWLARVAALAETAKPDLIVCTGDLADSNAGYGPELAAPLARLRAPLGKFAVFGNHEHYVGVEFSRQFLADCGFRLLRGESAVIADGAVLLVGADDPAGRRTHAAPVPGEDKLLPGRDRRELTILLKHQANTPAASRGRFDLQLSGHAHGGQIFPFGLFVRLAGQRLKGLYPLADGSAVYVSPGAGTWGPPMRLGAPPEVTLIIVEPEPAQPRNPLRFK